MSSRTPRGERESLQHAAEHERPVKRNPVLFYLMILFAAAFLLLLLSFFMQHRSNQEAIDNLQETSNSAVESLENKLKENDTLKEQVAQLEEENQALAQQVEEQAAQSEQTQGELTAILQALSDLNTLRSLYNQGRYSDARDFLANQPLTQNQTYQIEETLSLYCTQYADPAELEIYNPLEAWQQLVSWLG
ncbi:hypothetical protein [uncultured Flavonifractor sp.]|uniref:hypothetical protein n=1 Tax=uncultured Flavonifractor sp. TaxID=1193534 RepID=UPI002622152D|nr:hypothetical protein [uncultured Flavonifractor sp.]